MALTKILTEGIKDGEIKDADINTSANIATSKISGLATSATTDTTNAANISSGTLPDGRYSIELSRDTTPQLGGNLDSNSNNVLFPDSDGSSNILVFGTNNDLQISHTNNVSQLRGTTGNDIKIISAANFSIQHADTDGSNAENMVVATGDGSVELYWNGTKKFETLNTGVRIPDDMSYQVGTGADLQIFHNQTDNFIRTLNGKIYIDGIGGEQMITAIPDGAVELYWNGTKKFETSSIGTTTTGDSYVTGKVQIGGNSLSNISSFADDLVLGQSGSTAINGLTFCSTNSSGIRFHDTGDVGEVEFDHSDNSLTVSADGLIKVRTNSAERLRLDSSGKLSTGGETSPDVVGGGLCLNTGAEDGIFFSCKNSDIAHGRTANDETDTLFSIRKISAANGGAEIRAYTDTAGTDPAITIFGTINSASDANSCPVIIKGARAASGSGVGTGGIPADRGVVRISNDGDNTVATFTGEGLCFHSDTAAANALDDYEEGTYVATVYWSSSNTTGSYTDTTTLTGKYTKVGRMVEVAFIVYPSSYNSGSNCWITGISLPFTVATDKYASMSAYSGRGNYGGLLSTSSYPRVYAAFSATHDQIRLYVTGHGNGAGYYGHYSGDVNAFAYVGGVFETT